MPIDRLAHHLRYGPLDAASRLLKHALHRWIQWGSIVLLEQDLQKTVAVPGRATAEIRELRLANIALLVAFERDPADMSRRLERGDRAFAFFRTGTETPLHVRWVTTLPTWIPELALWLRPGPGEFYLYDVMTHPHHRGQRLSGLVGAAMDSVFSAHGFRKKLGYVRTDNHAMMRSMKWARVPLRQLFKISYCSRTNGTPRLFAKVRPPLYTREWD
jgi:hypothetical protein